MTRPWSVLERCLATSLPVLLFAAVAGGGAQTRPLPVPERPQLRLEVTVLRLDNATKAMVPIRADASFKTGDLVAFEVKASRGGYLALLASGTPEHRLWPQQATGEPTPSQATVRVPASGLIRLASPSPTKLSLLFSPRPLDGSSPRWLKQIILREAKLETGDVPAGPALIYEGSLGDAEKAVIELELKHP